MSNLSQFIGGVAGAKVGDIVELNSDMDIVSLNGRTYLKAGSEVLTSDYPNYTGKINKLNYKTRNTPRSLSEKVSPTVFSAFGLIATNRNGVWILVTRGSSGAWAYSNSGTNTTPWNIWRSTDNGVTWTCVFSISDYNKTVDAGVYQIYNVNSISTNYIGTWILRYHLGQSALNIGLPGHIFSEDDGLTWQFMPGFKGFNYLGSTVLKPYTRELVSTNFGDGDPLAAYSPDFGRRWTNVTIGASDNRKPLDQLPVFAPDGSYYLPYIGSFTASNTGYYLRCYQHIYLVEYITGPTRPASTGSSLQTLAFDSEGWMYVGGFNFAKRNVEKYQYHTTLIDLSTTIGFAATSYTQFLANPNSPIVYAANCVTSTCRGFKVSTDGGTTWSSERRAQGDAKYPAPNANGADMDNNGKIIGSGYFLYGSTAWWDSGGGWRRLSDVVVIANAAVSTNTTNLFPTINKLEKVNSSSFLAYSTRESTLYRGVTSNSALLPIFEAGNTLIFTMASNDTLTNVVIADGTTATIKYSNNGFWTNGTMNLTNYTSSPACNLFVDLRAMTQNVQESGFSYSTKETTATIIQFSSDGTKMYISGTQKANVDQYVLSTPWNPATATFDNKFLDLKSKETTPYAGYFKPDGTEFYTVGLQRNVHAYSLSTAWDISTATYKNHCNIAPVNLGSVTGLQFSPNGVFMITNESAQDRIHLHKLKEAWNIASANAYSRTFGAIQSNIDGGYGPFFKSDGKRFYYNLSGNIYEFGLSIPWDITSISYTLPSTIVGYRPAVSSREPSSSPLAFKPDGKRLFVTGATHDNVYSFEMNTSSSLESLSPIHSIDLVVDITYANNVFLAVTKDGYVIRSVDNGRSWDRRLVTNLYHPTPDVNRYNGLFYPKKIKMSSNGTAILITEFEMYRSTDYGNTFTQINDYRFKQPNRIDTDNNGIWGYSDYGGDLIFSYNDGNTWSGVKTPIRLAPTGSLTYDITSVNTATLDFAIVDSNTWAVIQGEVTNAAPNTFVYITKDSGTNWQLTSLDTQCNLLSLVITCGNKDLYLSSNGVSIGGISTIKSTIGLLEYKTKNDYLRVE